MGKALYRKYRPKNLVEVVGQEHITTTLANAINAGKISHAYLLTGTRGVGKTSLARILAHELNGIEYDETKTHLDIIEIDAASNRRIDEIRDLRDKVHILPTSNKYKVYIIDEVHMLTKEAFNALLKTLEEPPAHAIFILATTEAHKLPQTIVSRTQHFSFRPIEAPVIVNHLLSIAASEKFKIDTAALELIAQHGNGSFRDSISLLDQARGLSDNITAAEVQALLGIAPAQALEKLVAIMQQGSAKELFDLLAELRAQGLQSANLARQLGDNIRSLVISNPAYQNQQTLKLLEALLSVAPSVQPDRTLELVLLDYIFGQHPTPPVTSSSTSAPAETTTPKPTGNVETSSKRTSAVGEPATATTTRPASQKRQPTPKSAKASTPQIEPKPDTTAPQQTVAFDITAWPIVIAEVKKKYNTVYGILRMAQASVEGNTLTLTFKFPFHQKQINESKNRKIITDIIRAHTGQDVTLVCVIGDVAQVAAKESVDTKSAVSNVSDIFGGAEVLES